MKKSLFSTKMVVATAIGAALFFVIGKYVSLPSGIPNTNLSLQYGVLSFFAVVYGPIAGALIGFIGHFLIDLTAGWGVWWTWVVASGVTGLIVGLAFNKVNVSEGKFERREIINFVIFNVIAYAISWIVVAPVGDVLVYSEDPSLVFTQGLVSFAADLVVGLVVGGLLCFAYAKTIAKPGSLDKE